ncbi:hypothetical protein EMIT0324P_11534 [Pseudomonas chlororaphis]
MVALYRSFPSECIGESGRKRPVNTKPIFLVTVRFDNWYAVGGSPSDELPACCLRNYQIFLPF